MVNPVRIELNKEEIKSKTDSEKLDVLVDIAFANHTQLTEQGLLLYGNGDPKKGLCFKVATTTTRLNWLIAILSAIGTLCLGGFITYWVK